MANKNTEPNPQDIPTDQFEADATNAAQRIFEDIPVDQSFEEITPVFEQAPDFQKTSDEQPAVPTTRVEELEREVDELYADYLATKDPELQAKMKKLKEEIFWRREENMPGKPIKKY